jgi:hypothetical protein
MAAALNETPVRNTPSTEEPSRDIPSYTNPHSEPDRTTNIEMGQRTTTDLANMENRLDSNASSAVSTGQSSQFRDRPLQFVTTAESESLNLWPAEELYKHNFYADAWYKDIISIMISPAFVYILFLTAITAYDELNAIDIVLSIFKTWEVYVYITVVCIYTTVGMKYMSGPGAFLLQYRDRTIYYFLRIAMGMGVAFAVAFGGASVIKYNYNA